MNDEEEYVQRGFNSQEEFEAAKQRAAEAKAEVERIDAALAAQQQAPEIVPTNPATTTNTSVAPTQQPEPEQQQPQENDKFEGLKIDPKLDEYLPEDVKSGVALAVGLGDTVIGTLNLIPGLDMPQIPKFQDDVTQMVREFGSDFLPSLFLGVGGAGLAAKGVAALSNSSKAYRVLSSPPVKRMGVLALEMGVGAGVQKVVPQSAENSNNLGNLRQALPPSTKFLIPENIATLDSDNPVVKRNKNILEAVIAVPVVDIISQGVKFTFQGLKAKSSLSKFVGHTENGKSWVNANIKPELEPHAAVERAYAKRSEALDELGAYNLENATDPNAPVLGYHDVFDQSESGVRTVDDLGIVGASMDAARLKYDPDAYGGDLGSIATEPALKFMSSGYDQSMAVLKELASDLKAAEGVGFGKITPEQVAEVGEEYMNAFMEMDVNQLRNAFKFDIDAGIKTGIDADSQFGVLSSGAYNGAVRAIRGYMDEFINMDVEKARAYLVNSVAGQVSGAAEGMRLTAGSGSIQRAQEQVIERVRFLMNQKGMTSFSRGRALSLLDVWNKIFRTGAQKVDDKYKVQIAASLQNEGNSTLTAIDAIMKETDETINTLLDINKSNPKLLAPLMMAYELTDGDVKSISSLNNYINNSISSWSKGIVDMQPEIPSVVNRGFYANVYNNALSATLTGTKAAFSASQLLIEKPLRHLSTSALMKDKTTFRRAMYQYSNTLESLGGSMAYAKKIFKKSATDPNVTNVRENVTLRNQAQMDILNATADAHAAKGEYGMQVFMENVNAMNDIVDHPDSRLNTRFMQSFDGFVESMFANFESKGRAFDRVTENGSQAFDKDLADIVATLSHREMFDKNGIITDKAVKAAAGELSFTLDNGFTKGTSTLLRSLPVLKPFFLFTKTPINELAYTASYLPAKDIVGALSQKTGILSEFTKDLSKFAKPFDDANQYQIEKTLLERGVDFSNVFEAKGKYNEIRADILGRKGLGTVFTIGGIGLALNDRLRGAGHYNRAVQKTREKADYETNTFKWIDGEWYSLTNLGPIGTFLSIIGTVSDNFDILEPDDVGTIFKKLSFALAGSFKDKSTLANIEPVIDIIFGGDQNALKRVAGKFGSAALVPNSSLLAEFGRLFDPAALQIKNDLDAMILARLPFVKSGLPKEYDPINGGEVGVPDSLITRMFNHSSPFKRADKMTDRDNYIVEVEWSMADALESYKGVKLDNRKISEISNLIGKKNLFGPEIDRIMKLYPASSFRKGFKEAVNINGDIKPDVATYFGVHEELDQALRNAVDMAVYFSDHYTALNREAHRNEVLKKFSQRGDTEGANRFIESIKNSIGY